MMRITRLITILFLVFTAQTEAQRIRATCIKAKGWEPPSGTNVSIATDAGISAINSPSPSGCYTANETIIVTIQNFGTTVISNIPVTVLISGAVSQTLTSNHGGSIPVSGTATLAAGSVNMSAGGVYSFSAFTTYPGDANANNNSSITTRTVSPIVTITGPQHICSGSSATLNALGAATYTWDGGANSSSIVVTPSVSTAYSVAGTNTSGCTSVQFHSIAVQNPTIQTTDASGCGSPANGTLTASGFSGSTVQWFASPTSTAILGSGNSYSVSSFNTVTYYAEARSEFPGSLFTTLAGGNSFAGNMFDLIAASNLTISGIDWHFSSNITTTVEIWYRSGTFLGFETSNAGWTLAHTATLVPQGPGTLTPIPGTFAIAVPSGQQYALYITTKGGSNINYTNGSMLGNLYASNSDLQFYEGKGGGYFNVTNSPRIFNGVIRYKKDGCSSPRVPVTFSVVQGVTVTAATSGTSVCQGSNLTFTAYGAMNYTWLPSSMVSPPNGSLVTATPTTPVQFTVLGSIPFCTDIGSSQLTVSIAPTPTLSITPSQTVLPGSVVTLTVGGSANTFSWSPGGSNNTSILVIANTTEVYTVTGTNNFGCQSQITTTLAVGAVGIREQQLEQQLRIFPNPAKDAVTISISDEARGKYKFTVFDLTGRPLLFRILTGETQQVQLSELPTGAYVYELSGELIQRKGILLKQ